MCLPRLRLSGKPSCGRDSSLLKEALMHRKPDSLLEEQKRSDANWSPLRAPEDIEAGGAPPYQSLEIEGDSIMPSMQTNQTPAAPADDYLEDMRPVILGPSFLFEEAAHHEQVRAQHEKAKKYPSLVVDQKKLQRYGGKEALTPIDIERLAEDRPRRRVVRVWLTAVLLLLGGVGFTATSSIFIGQRRAGAVAFGIIGFLLIVPGVYSTCAIFAGWRGWSGYLDLVGEGA